jgi:hypothetical protein
MAYMRGANYFWRGEDDRLHIWIEDGLDPWDPAPGEPSKRPALGISVDQAVMDEYVMMRLAQLYDEREAIGAIDRAVARHDGNFGCTALVRWAPALRRLLTRMPDPG